MKTFYQIRSMIYPMSKKEWLSFGISLGENKESYLIYAKMHTKLPKFLAKAIKIYGENLDK